MDLLLNQASAIVSGGTKGIGLAIVNNFLKEGMNVTTFSRNKKNINSAKRKFNNYADQINILEGNILDESNCKKIIDSHIKTFNSLDALINNAGESIKNGQIKEKWNESFNINVTAHVIFSELAIPHLEKSKIGGSIINISSIFGRESGGSPQYNASKAAMISFSKSYANVLIKKGIRVNTIAPGSVRFAGGSWDKRVKNEKRIISHARNDANIDTVLDKNGRQYSISEAYEKNVDWIQIDKGFLSEQEKETVLDSCKYAVVNGSHTVMGEILGGHAKPIIGIPIYDEHTNQIEWVREKKLGLFAQNREQIVQAVREMYENYEEFVGSTKQFSKNFNGNGVNNTAKIVSDILEDKK